VLDFKLILDVLGSICFGQQLFWAAVTLGSIYFGQQLLWAAVVLGSSCFGQQLLLLYNFALLD
jgi:hypothetical protein